MSKQLSKIIRIAFADDLARGHYQIRVEHKDFNTV